MKNQQKKLKQKKELQTRRPKEETLKEVGKGFYKGVKPEDRKSNIVKEVDRRVLVDVKNTKVEVYKGDTRTDEEVIADYKRKFKK